MDYYDWIAGRVSDLRCRVRARGALMADTDKIIYNYKILEVTDPNPECISLTLLN